MKKQLKSNKENEHDKKIITILCISFLAFSHSILNASAFETNPIIQQAGNYFKIGPFESINSFADSRVWRMCNFKYKYYAKLDYKACFDSIYTHAFTWIIERNVVDAKDAVNSHLQRCTKGT